MADNTTNLKIIQYRYYSDGDSRNILPTDNNAIVGYINANGKYVNFLSGLGPAVKIGIQTLPGVKFYLNSLSDGIIINHSGVYEMDLRDTTTTISSLTFEGESLIRINEADNANLIIDIMYKGDSEE